MVVFALAIPEGHVPEITLGSSRTFRLTLEQSKLQLVSIGLQESIATTAVMLASSRLRRIHPTDPIDMSEFVLECSGGGWVLPWFWEIGGKGFAGENPEFSNQHNARLRQIQGLFDSIDADSDGAVTADELSRALLLSGVSNSTVRVLFEATNVWGFRTIDWWEFATQFQRRILPIRRAR